MGTFYCIEIQVSIKLIKKWEGNDKWRTQDNDQLGQGSKAGDGIERNTKVVLTGGLTII